MAWKADHKSTSRQRILSSAAKLFALNAYEEISINEVMEDAGLTRGAFYSHFKSKSELHAQAMLSSAKEIAVSFEHTSSESFVKTYLSTAHREGESHRCPLAFMIGDITQRGSEVHDTYTKIFKGFVKRLSKVDAKLDAKNVESGNKSLITQTQALQKAVLLIGGMAISRAINDDELAGQLLEACQHGLLDSD